MANLPFPGGEGKIVSGGTKNFKERGVILTEDPSAPQSYPACIPRYTCM